MKLITCIFFIFLTHTQTFAEKVDRDKCVGSEMLAKTDLKNNKVFFMLQGGIAPIRVVGQEIFEKKYHIKYVDLGCVVPSSLCIEHYNAEVGRFLDKKYGKTWRKQVRKDVVISDNK